MGMVGGRMYPVLAFFFVSGVCGGCIECNIWVDMAKGSICSPYYNWMEGQIKLS